MSKEKKQLRRKRAQTMRVRVAMEVTQDDWLVLEYLNLDHLARDASRRKRRAG